jgi:hypothetical protein
MKQITILILLMASLVSGQVTDGLDVFEDNGNYWTASNTDSVVWTSDEDSLFIAGAETAYVFIRTGNTLGMITYKGTVETQATLNHTADSARVVFEVAMLTGLSYNALDASVTETYYTLETTELAFGGSTDFYFYPFENTNLDQKHTLYWLMRIRGKYSTNLAKIYIKEERMRAY